LGDLEKSVIATYRARVPDRVDTTRALALGAAGGYLLAHTSRVHGKAGSLRAEAGRVTELVSAIVRLRDLDQPLIAAHLSRIADRIGATRPLSQSAAVRDRFTDAVGVNGRA
jgi:hypothetical protein